MRAICATCGCLIHIPTNRQMSDDDLAEAVENALDEHAEECGRNVNRRRMARWN